MINGSITVHCLKYGESILSENMAFINGEENKKIPISFAIYLINTEERKILVDAGCDTMPGFVMKDFRSPVVVLNSLGIFADEITDVIITHAHHDHIAAIGHFKNATVHITEEEYMSGKAYIPHNMSVNIINESYAVSPEITIKKWGGHSVGSAVVEIAYKEVVYVLAGDECYVNDCVVYKIPTGSYYNLDKSREFVEKYSNKRYCVCTCHDISLETERIL